MPLTLTLAREPPTSPNALGRLGLLLVLLVSVAAPRWAAAGAAAPVANAAGALGDHLVSAQQQEELALLFDQMFSTTVSVSRPAELRNATQAMGPTYAKCIQYDASTNAVNTIFEKAYAEFAPEGPDAAVGMRSVSKIFASAAFMALVDRGAARLDMTVKQGLGFDCGMASNASMLELLSMSSLAMDNRINAMRIAQLQKRGINADFLGFPPLCDELQWDLAKCVAQFICPVLGNDTAALALAGFAFDQDAVLDLTCGQTNANRTMCNQYAAAGFCSGDKRFMQAHCAFACAKDVRCDAEKGHVPRGNEAYQWEYDQRQHFYFKKVRRGMVYDNNGYTLVDAVVLAQTGRDLTSWATELVFTPLHMAGTLKCLSAADNSTADNSTADTCAPAVACYAPTDSVEAVFSSRTWPLWPGGRLTNTWISNAFFGSANDLSKFLAMLLRNGTAPDGQTRVLSRQSVDHILSPIQVCSKPMQACLGVHAWGMGAGMCLGADPALWAQSPTAGLGKRPPARGFFADLGTSMCLAPHVWGWASSYGSRFSLLRDRDLACVFLLNQYSGEMFSSRAHYLAHNASAVLRHVFPRAS
jgi:CubicO group peptidase (beta-lactamase class C family)